MFKKNTTKSRKLWGIGSYTVAWNLGVNGYPSPKKPWTCFDILNKAREFGCTVIQLCDNSGLENLTLDEILRLKKEADDAGILIETGLRGIEPDILMEHLNIARNLGSTRVRTLLDGPDSHPSTEMAIQQLKDVMPTYERYGVELMLENHDLRSCQEICYIIESVQSHNLGICLDTVNSLGILETPNLVIESLLPYTFCLHLKDFIIRRVRHMMGFVVEGTPTGEGMLQCSSLIQQLDKFKPNASIIIELWTPWQGDVDTTTDLELKWMDRSVQNIRQLLNLNM